MRHGRGTARRAPTGDGLSGIPDTIMHKTLMENNGPTTMDKEEVITKLVRYRRLLSRYMSFDRMILFGSYAQGTQREDSDVDVAIIVNETEEDYFSTRPLLWRLRREVDDRIEPVLFETKHDNSGFLQEIIRTGILIQDS
jgi:predicted nucleotidyltransferase